MINPVDLSDIVCGLFPEGVIADIWRDFTHGEWVIGNFESDEVMLNMTFEKLDDAENILLQNNIAYRIHDY